MPVTAASQEWHGYNPPEFQEPDTGANQQFRAAITNGGIDTDETDGMDGADEADGTDDADEADGTNETDETDGTAAADEADGTDDADETDGTAEADEADGTDDADETDGTAAADEADGTDDADETNRTNGTSGTNETDETAETEETDETDETGGIDESSTPLTLTTAYTNSDETDEGMPEPDELIEEFPLLNELDVLGMDTTITDADGNILNVSDATMQILFQQWHEGIEDGSITSDDPRYQAYYATLASDDLDNGRDVVPYHEYGWDTSETWEGDPVNATPEDMAGLYNSEEVQRMIEDAWADPVVLQELQDAQTHAIDAIDDPDFRGREATETAIRDMLLSDDFRNYVETLRWQGRDDEATQAMMTGIRSYSTLASEEEVNAVMQEVGVMDIVNNFETIMTDIENVDDAHLEAAIQDWAAASLEVIRSGLTFGSNGLSSIRLAETAEFLEMIRTNGSHLSAVAQVFRNFAASSVDVNNMDPADFQRMVNDSLESLPDTSVNTANAARNFMTNLNDSGAFNTMIGIVGLSAGVYTFTNGSYVSVDHIDHIDNLVAARGFLIFLGNTAGMARLVSNSFPSFMRFMGAGDASSIFASPSIQKIFDIPERPTPPHSTGFLQVLTDHPTSVADVPDDQLNSLMRFVGDDFDRNIATRIVAGFIRVVDTAAYFAGGIVDLVIGGLMIHNAQDNWDRFYGAMQVIAGSLGTIAGTSVAASVAGYSAAGIFIAPFAWASVAVSLTALGVLFFRHFIRSLLAEDDNASIHQRDYFNTMGNLGLLQDDWGDRVGFLVHSFYGDDSGRGGGGLNSQRPNTPDGVGVFEHYDWQRWMDEYNELHDEDYTLPDGPPPMYPNTIYSQITSISIEQMAQYYRQYYEGLDEPSRTVPTLNNEYLRTRFGDLVEFYYRYSIDPDNPPTTEQAAEWAWNRLAREVQRSLGGLELPGGDGELNPANQEIRSIMDNHWSLHGGDEIAYGIANTVVEERGLNGQGLNAEFTGAVDSLVEIYRNGIDTENRTVPAWSNANVNQLWRDIFQYYYTYINPNGNSYYNAGPDQGDGVATDWAMRHILAELREIDPALENILYGNYVRHNGWRDAIQIANEVLAGLDPNATIHPVPA